MPAVLREDTPQAAQTIKGQLRIKFAFQTHGASSFTFTRA